MRMLNLIVVLAAWCLFVGEAAAVEHGFGGVGVGTGASIDVETVNSQKSEMITCFRPSFSVERYRPAPPLPRGPRSRPGHTGPPSISTTLTRRGP